MEETIKYIITLNRLGHSGFMIVQNDSYEDSIKVLEERHKTLNELNDINLLKEATRPNAMELLRFYTDAPGIGYSYEKNYDGLVELYNKRGIINGDEVECGDIELIFERFKDSAEERQQRGVWTEEQMKDYWLVLSNLKDLFKTKLKLFIYAYRLDASANIGYESEREDASTKSVDETKITTPRKEKFFKKAVEAGFMERRGNGYKWLFQDGKKAALGYFVEKVFCPNNTEELPEQALNALFGVKRLGSAITQMNSAKKPQEWKADIDRLFSD